MTAELTAAALRALLVATLATATAWQVRRLQHWPWLLACYFAPSILTGYAYFTVPWLYTPLLWFKFTPLAVLVLHFAPRTISPSALHCHRMLRPRDWVFLIRCGAARPFLAAFALVALLTFQEFELASLLGVKTWTVWLFDAHAGGMSLRDSVQLAMPALLCELVFLAGLLGAIRGGTPAGPTPARVNVFAWMFLAVAMLVMLILPAAIVLRGAWRGMPVVVQNFALRREVGASVLFGALSATLAFVLAKRPVALWLSLPALLGPLVLALLILALFQIAWPLRDSIVPVVLALTLLLLPIAVLLRFATEPSDRDAALHLARHVRKPGPLIWQLQTRRQFFVLFVLFGWAYLELTASSILAPVALTPAVVRLYNLMHYGQTAVLSAMLSAVLLVPLGIGAIAYALGTRTHRS